MPWHTIEEHLTEEIDYREVSKIAYYSEYHFKRMFSFLSGIRLSEYIRRSMRRLKVLKFCGMRAPTLAIRSIEAEFRFQ